MSRSAAIAAVATVLAAVAVSPASGASTRAEYVAEAEPICKRAAKKAAKSFRGIKFARAIDRIIEGRFEKFLRVLAKVTGRTNKPLGKMVKRLYSIVPPPGDEVRVAQWLDGLGDSKRLTDRYVRSTFARKYKRASRFQVDSIKALVGGARFVNGWGFENCPGGEVITEDFEDLVSARSLRWWRR